MRRRRLVHTSLRALVARPGRAVLALASVAIGVAAVLLAGAAAAGARSEVLRRLDAMGPRLLVVRPAQVGRSSSRKSIRGVVSTLRMEDFEAVARLPLVAAAAPGAERPVIARGGGGATRTKVLGTSPSYLGIRNFRIRAGRFFDATDDREARRVAVLGSRVAEALFGDADAIGREIRVGGVLFDVVGVLESKGVLADGSDEDDQILVPIRTALRRVFNATWLTGVFVSVADRDRLESARSGIAALLGARHGRDDFSVQNTEKMLAMQQRAADLLSLLTGGVGAVALGLGGGGIFALMMMSVKERTAEIGLRRALGATQRDVYFQFLFESTLLAAAGWLAGAALGAAGTIAVVLVTGWTLGVPLAALGATAILVGVAGAGFGSLPARKAARLPPAVGLRSR